jgi:ParB family chromosome partitioning protein
LLGTPDRGFQEQLAKRIVAEGLTVRAVEEEIRIHSEPFPGSDEGPGSSSADGAGQGVAGDAGQATRSKNRLPAPGVLELEELLSSHLNTRVKVEVGAKKGRVIVDFATLEDLERIYRLMVANGAIVQPG